MTNNLQERLSQLLAEAKELMCEGHRLSRITLNLETDQIEYTIDNEIVVYEETQLQRHQRETINEHSGWVLECEKWKRSAERFGDLTLSGYLHRLKLQLKALLESDFLIPDMDFLPDELIVNAHEALARMNLDVQYAPKMALLCLLAKLEDGVFSFENTLVLEQYLEEKKDCLSHNSVAVFLRFKYNSEHLKPFIDALPCRTSPRATRHRVKPLPEPEVRRGETFRVCSRITTPQHLTYLFAALCSEGWLGGESDEFLRLFSGEPNDCQITWQGHDADGRKVGIGTLKELFAELIRQNVITCLCGEYVSVIESHFIDDKGKYLANVKSSGEASLKTRPAIQRYVGMMKMRVAELIERIRE